MHWPGRMGLVTCALLFAACSNSDVVEVREWTLIVGDTERPVSVPSRPDIPGEIKSFRLRARVAIPASWSKRTLTFAFPTLPAAASLTADGQPATAIDVTNPLGQPDIWHSWRVVDRDGDGHLALELTIAHERLINAWLVGVPRLSPTERGDRNFLWARAVDRASHVCAFGALLLIVSIYLGLWLWDRHRRVHLWFALQALCALALSGYYAGIFHSLLGAHTELVPLLATGGALVFAPFFLYAHFGAGRVPRGVYYASLAAVAVAPVILVFPRQFGAAFAIQAALFAYIIIRICAFLIHARQRHRFDANAFLAAWGLIVIVSFPDQMLVNGVFNLTGGARCASIGFMVFGMIQAFVLARHQIAVTRELEEKAAVTSRELEAALARLPAAVATFASGSVIDDRYRVVRSIGHGAMGRVFEVERMRDGHRFALKAVAGHHDPARLARFAREARIATSLDHGNLVRVIDVGVADSAGLYLVMELVDGASLADCRDRYGDVDWACNVLGQVAGGLVTMHQARITHRDLKPANILVSGELVKITDFGLAGMFASQIDALAQTVAAARLTGAGERLGTPLYMAPEVASASGDASPAADMWSFGVLAHELLAGRMPFDTPPLLDVLSGRPVPAPVLHLPDDLDPAIATIIERCLAIDPEQRPDATALAAAFA